MANTQKNSLDSIKDQAALDKISKDRINNLILVYQDKTLLLFGTPKNRSSIKKT